MKESVGGRFWARVDRRAPDECWEWTAVRDRHGYGQVYYQGKVWRAHRVALLLSGIELVRDLDVDHLCRNRACVNPAHLEQVPHRVNCQRGDAGARERERTNCIHGHPFDVANTYLRPVDGRVERQCRACMRETQARFVARRRASLAAAAA